MPDQLLSPREYAEIRAAIAQTFTDTVVFESVARANTSNGTATTYTLRNSGQGLVRDLSGYELVRVQQFAAEASVEVQVDALRAVEKTDRVTITNGETGAVRVLQVVFIQKPSREFVRKCLCKDYSSK